MPNFNQTRQALQQARNRRAQTDEALFRVKERVKQTEEAQRQLRRVFREGSEPYEARLRELQRREESARAEMEKLQSTLRQEEERYWEVFGQFAPFTDPREFVGQMDDRYPFLLFPLRIETRFKEVQIDNENFRQLWVRIFPDEGMVDTFEEVLAESEVENARRYWVNHWKAGGFEEQERGAWRGLVSSHGSGRSAYIREQYAPLHPEQQPTKENAADIILVIASQQPLPEGEREAVANFWIAVWRAGTDQSAIQNARNDLVAKLGENRAAAIESDYVPDNMGEEPAESLTREEVGLQLVFLDLPNDEAMDTKQQSWSRAPRVNLMPDRFVLMGWRGNEKELEIVGNPVPSPLYVGPDPTAEEDNQIKLEDGNLEVNPEIRWLVDFDTAVEIGMGFRINLNPEQARRGFDKLIVLGLRLSSDQMEGKGMLEELFRHHQFGAAGLELLPQGRPTNNTEKGGSGFSASEDADDSFNTYVKAENLLEPTNDWLLKKDGQILAEALGLDLETFRKTPNATGADQCEAKAMNIALWPSTMGYFMESMMQPVFPETTIGQTRNFFNRHIRGRGAIPALRIGEQPYGILLTAAYSRLRWFRRDTSAEGGGIPPWLGKQGSFINGLYGLLQTVQNDWNAFLENVAYVGKPGGDAHQILLDAVGLHATTVEFYQRYAESFEMLFNKLNLGGLGGKFIAVLIAGGYVQSGKELLSRLGAELGEDEVPEILSKLFLSKPNLLKGPLIDDQPFSEKDPIRAWTEDDRNYIQWLMDAANTSHDALRKQEGFIDDQPPSTLLYLMLHHALDLAYVDAGLQLHVFSEVLGRQEAFVARQEPAFIHVQDRPEQVSESKWNYLYKADNRITDNDDLLIADYIPQVLDTRLVNAQLNQQLRALGHLKNVPTARLERVFTEHIDTCSYRLDAWKQGILNFQLEGVRSGEVVGGEETSGEGLYLGAFGWLEEVRPENKQLTPVELPEELEEIFKREGDSPLMRDSANAGYIHAPSLNHAVTAAVLRNGYLSNATPDNPQTLSVNLSSERVRQAMGIIEGIRNGQSLAALLGYQLERGLHDRHDVEVDFYIFQLRKIFPLVSDQLQRTKTEPDVPIEAIEARNVVHGLNLINHIQETGNAAYPFGKELPDATPAQAGAINEEVDRIRNLHDAVADLGIAEGVHQVVQGNYGRAAAALDAYSKGSFPPIPDLVQTPRSGFSLTHRMALQLEAELGHNEPPDATPRSLGEPAVNRWLSQVLPVPENIACTVIFFDPVGESDVEQEITQADLQLQPIDLLYMMNTESDQAMTALDDRVLYHIRQTLNPRPDAEITIRYTQPITDKVTFFELMPLIRSLRALLLRSRPLKATDIRMPEEAKSSEEQEVFVEAQRILAVKTRLLDQRNNLQTQVLDQIEPLVDVEDIETNREAIIAALDQWIDDFLAVLQAIGRFGFLQPSTGNMLDRKRAIYRQMLDQVREVVSRWEDLLSEFDNKMADYDALPPATADEDRLEMLRLAERLISTAVFETGVPADLRNQLNTLRQNFSDKLDALRNILTTNTASLAQLRTLINDEWPLTDFDPTPFELTDAEKQMQILAEDLLRLATSLAADLDRRDAAAQEQIDRHDATASGPEKAEAMGEAAKVLLGEDFKIVPEFRPVMVQADEWEKTWNARSDLLNFQQSEMDNPFPVEDWLHGLARVREKVQHWENVTFLADALRQRELAIEPLQFPFRENDRWLGMTFRSKDEDPAAFTIDTDKLLYTAYYAEPFDRNKRQCGLLLDEWTEVIPTKEESTGLTFQYDRPNSEPPQTMLLTLPTHYKGSWDWPDLVDALLETLEMAKQRAIEPDQIDNTAYARFLPATVSSTTVFPITAMLNYSLNNQFYTVLTTESDE